MSFSKIKFFVLLFSPLFPHSWHSPGVPPPPTPRHFPLSHYVYLTGLPTSFSDLHFSLSWYLFRVHNLYTHLSLIDYKQERERTESSYDLTSYFTGEKQEASHLPTWNCLPSSGALHPASRCSQGSAATGCSRQPVHCCWHSFASAATIVSIAHQCLVKWITSISV